MMAEPDTTVLFHLDGALGRITLNRPEKRNALNHDLIAGLKTALQRAEQDENIRAIVLTGAGLDFCSGADLESLKTISEGSVSENVEDARALMDLLMLIRAVRVPVIATVHGRALAGGCGLATACDLVLAARSARFGYPEVRIGFVPAMVMAILGRNVSEKKAFELLTLGTEIDADEAVAIGLVNHAFDDETFADEVEVFVRQFEKTSRSAVKLTKRLLYQVAGATFEDALQCGLDTNVLARMTEDCQNGIKRFLMKG